jgi:hypothetical protein
MNLTMTGAERALVSQAVQLLEAELKKADKALERCQLSRMEVEREQSRCGLLLKVIHAPGDPVPFDPGCTLALRTALEILHQKVTKLRASEEDLTVDTNGTEARLAEVRAFADRLRGQPTLFPNAERDRHLGDTLSLAGV